MSTDLIGTVWYHSDGKRERWVRVEAADGRYAYVVPCNSAGMTGRPWVEGRLGQRRIQLDATGGLSRYRREEQ